MIIIQDYAKIQRKVISDQVEHNVPQKKKQFIFIF